MEDEGSALVDSDGEGICCIFFSLVPLFSGFRLCLLRAFSVKVESVEIFGSIFFRLITVPRRRSPPPKPAFLGVGGSGARLKSVWRLQLDMLILTGNWLRGSNSCRCSVNPSFVR